MLSKTPACWRSHKCPCVRFWQPKIRAEHMWICPFADSSHRVPALRELPHDADVCPWSHYCEVCSMQLPHSSQARKPPRPSDRVRYLHDGCIRYCWYCTNDDSFVQCGRHVRLPHSSFHDQWHGSQLGELACSGASPPSTFQNICHIPWLSVLAE